MAVAVLIGAATPAVAAPARTPVWTASAGSRPGYLYAVSCASPQSCAAVGYARSSTLVEAWNGSTWKVMRSGSRGSFSMLAGVSCWSTTRCAAVGTAANRDDYALIVVWNGVWWSVRRVPMPPGTELNGVSCARAASCVAVGRHGVSNGTRPFVVRWDGHRWTRTTLPNPLPGWDSTLRSVSCPTPTRCFAVGDTGPVPYDTLALIETWDGHRWSVMPAPQVPGTRTRDLAAVSCASATSCFAVGSINDPTGAGRALMMRWNGETWTIVPTPPFGLPNALRELRGVSCASPTSCVAVGDALWSDDSHQSRSRLLLASWDGTHWSVTRPPPAIGDVDQLTATSCRGGYCKAVGYSYDTRSVAFPLLLSGAPGAN